MSLLEFFGSSISASEEEKRRKSTVLYLISICLLMSSLYIILKNGGKFLYCENLAEVKEQFENILEENDWFESDVLFDTFSILEENKQL
jgi:hypothetical protein